MLRRYDVEQGYVITSSTPRHVQERTAALDAEDEKNVRNEEVGAPWNTP